MRQTIVCRHIIQAELIVGEQRVSPPEAAARTEERLIKQHEKRIHRGAMKSATGGGWRFASRFLASGSKTRDAEPECHP